jgi:hypothetical protein
MRKLTCFGCLVIAAGLGLTIASTASAAPASTALALPGLQSLGRLDVQPVHCRFRRHCHRYCWRAQGQRRCRTYCHRCGKRPR